MIEKLSSKQLLKDLLTSKAFILNYLLLILVFFTGPLGGFVLKAKDFMVLLKVIFFVFSIGFVFNLLGTTLLVLYELICIKFYKSEGQLKISKKYLALILVPLCLGTYYKVDSLIFFIIKTVYSVAISFYIPYSFVKTKYYSSYIKKLINFSVAFIPGLAIWGTFAALNILWFALVSIKLFQFDIVDKLLK